MSSSSRARNISDIVEIRCLSVPHAFHLLMYLRHLSVAEARRLADSQRSIEVIPSAARDRSCRSTRNQTSSVSSKRIQLIGMSDQIQMAPGLNVRPAERFCAVSTSFALTRRGKYIGCVSPLTRPARH